MTTPTEALDKIIHLHRSTTVEGLGSGIVTYEYCISCNYTEGYPCATVLAAREARP